MSNDHLIDEHYTRRALQLAAEGIGRVSPNPLVGCVIVSAEGEIAGEGAYFYDKVIHAEVIALEQAGGRARGGVAYVSLEPHSHHGKTPPCTEALINAGIKRVVCPIEDPNPLVSGRGFESLRAAGVEVVTGILKEQAAKLNEAFICWHKKQRPFIHLKLAMSLDGRISLKKCVSTALSGASALKHVHSLRHRYDAILVGGSTVSVDNPSLTDRSGMPRRKPLVRVVLDNRLQIPMDSEIVKTALEIPTILFTRSDDRDKIDQLFKLGISVVESEAGARDLDAVLKHLMDQGVQSILVEGGATIAGAFCDARLVDKITFIAAPMIIGGGDAPTAIGGQGAKALRDALRLHDISITRFGDDIEITGYPAA